MTIDEARNIFYRLRIGQTVIYYDSFDTSNKKIITAIEKCSKYGTCGGTRNEKIRVCNGNKIGFDGGYPICISACRLKRKCNIVKIITEDFIEEDEFMI